ncbi:MAG TPA: hypothetical protein VM055_04515 [Novosphingobium sp.]|nr:hypothetical protein [Novosphingobium sp.]
MRKLSMGKGRLLSAALVVGVAMASASPAFAADKKKEVAAPTGPKISLSKGFQPIALAAQKAIDAAKADPATAPAARTALDAALAAATTNDEKFFAGQLAVNLGGAAKDPALQRRGLQLMVDSNKTPADNGKYNFFISSLAYNAKDYAAAQAAAQAAINAGYSVDESVGILSESYFTQNQNTQGLAALKQAVTAKRAAGKPVPESWLKRAISVAYKNKLTAEATEWSTLQLELYPTPLNWLGTTQLVRLVGNYSTNETIDLFRLMWRSGAFDNDPKIVANEYKEYVEAADPRRLPGETLAVIDKARAGGILREQWVSDARALAAGRIAADKASLTAASARALASGTGLDALSTGDAYLNYGDAAKAEALYKAALGKSGVDKDRVLTRLGIAQYDQGKYADAKASFSQIGGQRAAMAKLWLMLVKAKSPTV